MDMADLGVSVIGMWLKEQCVVLFLLAYHTPPSPCGFVVVDLEDGQSGRSHVVVILCHGCSQKPVGSSRLCSWLPSDNFQFRDSLSKFDNILLIASKDDV